MTAQERQRLKEAVRLMSGPSGDSKKGWAMLCHLAGLDPAKYPLLVEESAPERTTHTPEDYTD